jgi:hypothetical protein
LLLADRDAFTQDCASKGIGIVYELGDASLKQELVDSLVSTLAEGRKVQAQSVQGDTQLFGENTLGTSPDGSSITTYQSILSLASDMNQPEIVYKFMNLGICKCLSNGYSVSSIGLEFKTRRVSWFWFDYDYLDGDSGRSAIKAIFQGICLVFLIFRHWFQDYLDSNSIQMQKVFAS